MARVWYLFQACGFSSYFCLLLGGLALAGALVAVILALARLRAAVAIAWLALGLSFGPVAAGGFGVVLGRAKTDQAIAGDFIDPEQRERIRAEGYEEAGGCATIGGSLSVPPLVLACVALAIAYSLRRATPAVPRDR